ncbi:hypothetical protein R6V09_01395 [Streptomyces sp. W16]|uniref:hypothetical protein n=1 Tax=Streptomyces sp. W16 TaxID=3076631 RepID=UPI00295A814F|nr:hypothetical protein [Streptomyces sp. W16]MDV9168799.1 hypothetical protein [Streptomyces sp. W16]
MYGTTLMCRVKATRAAPATSGAFADAVTSAVPPLVPAHRSEAWAVPSASTRQPDARTKTGAELRAAVHRLSSVRGRRTSDTTVPGRTQSRRTTASPGLTVTSARPAAQLRGEAEEPVADADGLPPVGTPDVCVDAPADGPFEPLLSDGPPTGPPPSDA